jgi:hypothetical protein
MPGRMAERSGRAGRRAGYRPGRGGRAVPDVLVVGPQRGPSLRIDGWRRPLSLAPVRAVPGQANPRARRGNGHNADGRALTRITVGVSLKQHSSWRNMA